MSPFSRSFNKRVEDAEVLPSSGKVRCQLACEEAFDKLCESPSFSPLKPVPVSENTGKVVTTLDLLFSDLPGDEDGPADDPEDRLIISETEVSEAEQENLFTYSQEIFPSNEIPDAMEFSKEEVKADNTSKEKSLPGSSKPIPIIIETKQTASKLSQAGSVAVELKPFDVKSSEVGPALSPALSAPAPISTRLPATSTIEEKLSAAALAFKNKSKDARKEEEEQRKSLKESLKKSETSVIVKKSKEDQGGKTTDCDTSKKGEDEKEKKNEEEERREVMRMAIKQKEEELQQLKMKKEAAEAKAAAVVAEQKKVAQEKREEEQKRRDDEALTRKEEDRREREQKIKEKEKRKRVISQEFVDDTDSSDSDQRLVIDNEESPEEKNAASNFDIKLRAELEKLQDIQEGRTQIQPPTAVEDHTIIECKPIILPILKSEEEVENINSLLCEEEIPGSPAPIIDNVDQISVSTSNQLPSQVEISESNIVLLEMPFASAPTSGQSSASVGTVSTVSVSAPKNPDVSVPVSLPVQQGLILGARAQPLSQSLPQAQAQGELN